VLAGRSADDCRHGAGVTSSAPDSARAPTGTPPEIIQRLNEEINTGLAEPRIKARFDKLGAEPMPMTLAEFGKLVADETGKWAKVVKFFGAKAD
jgi:tripartite-type tricarboxylate transporter receptor subunit TctC